MRKTLARSFVLHPRSNRTAVSHANENQLSRIPTSREAFLYATRLALLLRPHWSQFRTTLVLRVFVTAVGLVLPLITKAYFDTVYPTRDLALLRVLLIAFFAVSILNVSLTAMSSLTGQLLDARVWGASSLLYFNQIQHLPSSFFDTHQVGEVLSRFSDLRASISAITQLTNMALSSAIYLATIPFILFTIHWKLAAVALLSVPITTAASTVASRVVRKYWKRSTEESAALAALQFEALSHIRTIKHLAAEPAIYASLRSRTQAALNAQLSAGNTSTALGSLNGVINILGTVAFTWYAWAAIIHGEMSIGDFVVFSAYLSLVTPSLNQFTQGISEFQHTAVCLGRAFEYLDAQPEQDPQTAHVTIQTQAPASGAIVLRAVSFGYVPGAATLQDISLEFLPGSVTALVGASGAGKTSLVKLLARIVEPTHGAIALDGLPLAEYPMQHVRQHIAVVNQDTSLLRGSLWDNVTYGLDQTSPDLAERVTNALAACQLNGFVDSLPNGLRTPIAEWGATVSGGQRQRICIARALVRKSTVLVLDEATSQIDVPTEQALLAAVFSASAGRTVIFTTHRMRTAALANRVCVLADGRIVGCGRDGELQRTCAEYLALVQESTGVGLAANVASHDVIVTNAALHS